MLTSGPHCDAEILHAPKTCTYCDRYKIQQGMRIVLGINFTNTHDPNKKPCPAYARRGEGVNYWHGNVAADADFLAEQEAYYAELARIFREYENGKDETVD